MARNGRHPAARTSPERCDKSFCAPRTSPRNTSAIWDFNAETMGLGYYTWPMPVWFLPFTTTSHQALNGILPQGPITLIFDVILKPGITVDDFTDDLILFGNIANDYSWTDFPSGQTWFLWSSTPMLSPIDTVLVP